MSEQNPDKIKPLFEKAKEARQPHEAEIREAYQLVKPTRRFDLPYDQSVHQVNHDATIARSTRNLVTNITRLLIPQNRRWHDVAFRNELRKTFLNKLDRNLVEANEYLFRFYQQSNFYLAMNEALNDAVISGVGCILIQDFDGEDLNFVSVPVGELYFLQDAFQKIDSVFRSYSLNTRQLLQRFPDAEIELDEKITKYEILEACIPCDKKFEHVVYLKKDFKVLEKKTTKWNPFVIFRWERDTGSVWGYSPVRASLPHIRAANQMTRDTLLFGEYAAKGVFQVEDESYNTEHLKGQLKPGSIIAIDKPIKGVQFPGNFPISFDLIRMETEAIKQIMLDNALPSEDALKYMTAEAVIQQQTQFLTYIGEPAQRLSVEFLQPLGDQVVSRMMFRGDLTILTLEDIQGFDLPGIDSQDDIFRVDVNAAIHRANKMQEAGNSVNALMKVGQVAQFLGVTPQQVAVHLDTDKFIRETLLAFDFDIEMLRDPKDAAKLTEELGGQSKLLQMMQLANSGMDIAKKASDAGMNPLNNQAT